MSKTGNRDEKQENCVEAECGCDGLEVKGVESRGLRLSWISSEMKETRKMKSGKVEEAVVVRDKKKIIIKV